MQEKKQPMNPRVLTFSIPCWNNRSGSDTLSNLFDGYDNNSIANIYFKTDIPNSKVCTKYFCVMEDKVIKSIFNRKIETGKEIKAEDCTKKHIASESEIKEKKRYEFWRNHRLWTFLLLRELLWFFGNWHSKNLDSFIDNFNPDILFFPLEGYIYFNRFILKVIEKTKCPSVGFLWDDNFTYKQYPWNPMYRIHRFFLRKTIKKIVKNIDSVFTINNKMKKEFDKEFSVKSTVLSKGVKFEMLFNPLHINDFQLPLHITYTGKTDLGRDKAICTLIDVVKEINIEQPAFFVDIYSSSTPSKSMLKKLNTPGISQFHGSVSQDEVKTIQKKSDMLLLAESLNSRKSNVARLSFSTKVTDYLASGKCIFALLPKDNATYEFIKENEIGMVASNKNEIKECLMQINQNKNILNKYSEAAYNIARNNFDICKMRKKLIVSINHAYESRLLNENSAN